MKGYLVNMNYNKNTVIAEALITELVKRKENNGSEKDTGDSNSL